MHIGKNPAALIVANANGDGAAETRAVYTTPGSGGLFFVYSLPTFCNHSLNMRRDQCALGRYPAVHVFANPTAFLLHITEDLTPQIAAALPSSRH